MKTFISRVATLATALLVPGAFLAAHGQSSSPDLTVDQQLGNSPYTLSSGTDLNNVTVGLSTQGLLTQNDGVFVYMDGQLTLGNLPGSTGEYDLGGNTNPNVSPTVLSTASLIIGNGGQGTFDEDATGQMQVRGTVSFQAMNTSSGGTFQLGGLLAANQIGQNSGTAAGTFYFLGGAVEATQDNATFMQGLKAAYIYLGATFYTEGYNITVAQSLLNFGSPMDGGLTKASSGTLTLTGANTYTGPTAINGGTLNAGSAGALGNGGAITFGGGTLQYSAASAGTDFSGRFSTAGNQAISLDTNGQSVTLGTGLAGGGTSLTKLGAGTLTLTAASTYTGATAINAGVLNAGNATALGNGGAITFGGGILQYSAASAGTDFSARFSSAGNQAVGLDTNSQSVTIGYGFGGNGTTLAKLGAGTLTINGGNTYTGATTLNAGTVLINNPGALGNGGAITFSGGTLQYGDTSHSDSDYNNADFSGRFSTANGQRYSINTGNHNISYGTALTSPGGSLTKSGTGTLTLSGNNTYSGQTMVTAGTLLLNGSNTGRGNVFVDGSGPAMGGTGSTTAAVTVKNGTINPGGNAGAAGAAVTVGNLTVGSLTLSSGSTFALDVNSATNYDVLTANGNVSLGSSALSVNVNPNASFATGQTLDLVHLTSGRIDGTFAGIANNGVYTFGGDPFQAVYTQTDFELVAVPEPTTILAGALLAAAGGVSLARRRRAAEGGR